MAGESPMASKKFLAYLLAELTWKIVLGVALWVFRDDLISATAWGWWFMITVAIVAGFVEVGFIGGQAWLDRYVHVAEIATRKEIPTLPDSAIEDEPTEG